MRVIDATKGEIIRGAETYPYEIADDKVRIKLPFYVDLKKLTAILKQKEYFVANDPEETDSQGWGKWYDAEGYYPYWVYEENHCHYFAFPPEDYKVVPEPGAAPRHVPILGTKAVEEFFRWLPVLKEAQSKGEPERTP
ncbi:hypothetical protein [Thermoanaerobacterium sp. DL9XJH110]|uniref:hypothetical protein n=1 Tax=Thermoanaerobacterium sp. DL9XJH110 TaxID=3386643 RepID=UPI003BB7D3E4